MTKKFLRKVIRDGSAYTRNYAYRARPDDFKNLLHILRIDIDALDTTASLAPASDTNPNGWETLMVLSADDIDRIFA